ncbi:Usg family protein [Azospirillum sp. INR13]|uniref:Usg family protein n=1 Tax=Azospirillum sp. INR13 TaxID=2596919 RepID=UPI0018926C20|nr:Usg family protein [Azospirillum sp. INR13]MBF5093237.1 Usg family protein [Azospirillum sp. INR13]
MANLVRQLRDFRLTTAEILYHMPEYPGLLQCYLWPDLDQAPEYPVLRRSLDFWQRNLDGKLHSVRLATQTLITPGALRHAAVDFRIH